LNTTTSTGASGLPSWKGTPLRKVMTQVVTSLVVNDSPPVKRPQGSWKAESNLDISAKAPWIREGC
jgi:hypothetical protein